jgi:hypothetical protein
LTAGRFCKQAAKAWHTTEKAPKETTYTLPPLGVLFYRHRRTTAPLDPTIENAKPILPDAAKPRFSRQPIDGLL